VAEKLDLSQFQRNNGNGKPKRVYMYFSDEQLANKIVELRNANIDVQAVIKHLFIRAGILPSE